MNPHTNVRVGTRVRAPRSRPIPNASNVNTTSPSSDCNRSTSEPCGTGAGPPAAGCVVAACAIEQVATVTRSANAVATKQHEHRFEAEWVAEEEEGMAAEHNRDPRHRRRPDGQAPAKERGGRDEARNRGTETRRHGGS